MMRRWVGVAAIAGCLGLMQAARAQYPGALPEPIPFSPQGPQQAGPNLIPGPLNSQIAPQGPSPDLTLPDDGTGAFPCKTTDPEEAWFFHAGFQFLQRPKISNGFPLAVRDAGNTDTGNPPAAGDVLTQQLSEINPHFNAGPRATFGYLLNGNQDLEITGYYIFQGNQSANLLDPGRIDSFFFNPPIGFEGDNGMFVQADRLDTTFTTTQWSLEGLYRYTDPAVTGAELIVGVRYLDLEERIRSRFDDDGVQFPMTNGLPDPMRVATYSVQTHNRLVAPELGFEWVKNLTPRLGLGVTAKGAWGADFVDLNRSLIRGDGFVGFAGQRSVVQLSQMYEVGAFVDISVLERARVHLGYNAMWFLNMANVVDQYDFNLQNTNNFGKRDGGVFFHGPVAEIEFLF